MSNIPTDIQQAIENLDIEDIRKKIKMIEPAPLMAATEEELLPHTVGILFKSAIRHGSTPDNIEPATKSILTGSGVSKVSVSQISAFKARDFSTNETSTNRFNMSQISTSQISPFQTSITQIGGKQISISQNCFSQTSLAQISPEQIASSQISLTKIDPFKISSPQVNPSQDTPFESSNLAINPISFTHFADNSQQFNPIKITLPSFVTSQQLISSDFPNHDSISNLVSNFNNSAINPSNSPGLLNGNFDITNHNDPDYGWNQRGAATLENSKAILTKDSPFNSNFSQTFSIPEGAKTLQFTLTVNNLFLQIDDIEIENLIIERTKATLRAIAQKSARLRVRGALLTLAIPKI